jgi:hypothetical protein
MNWSESSEDMLKCYEYRSAFLLRRGDHITCPSYRLGNLVFEDRSEESSPQTRAVSSTQRQQQITEMINSTSSDCLGYSPFLRIVIAGTNHLICLMC